MVKRILAGKHRLVCTERLADAAEQLAHEHFDMIVVGLHFDESKMFELIERARASAANLHTPIVCLCNRDTRATRLIHDSTSATVAALGCWMYLDRHRYNVMRDPEPELGRIAERCLVGVTRTELLNARRSINGERVTVDEKTRPERRWALTRDLEALQARTRAARSKIEESRERGDRVSDEVVSGENRMTVDELRADEEEKRVEA